ncbi:MAG: phasin family protein [Pseudomonadota bacterium]|jgi:hypothetical protein|nr:phasin family protein [Alphaproteobacteria bacterium]
MAQAKNAKGHAGKADWKEQQHKYTQTAKEMFEKFSDFAKESKPHHEKIMENHKKNLEAIGEANKVALDVLKSLAKMQSEFVKQTFEEMNSMMRAAMTQKPGQPIDMSKYSDTIQHSLQRTVEHSKNVNSVLSNSGKEIHAKMKGRFEEMGADMKAHASKYGKH